MDTLCFAPAVQGLFGGSSSSSRSPKSSAVCRGRLAVGLRVCCPVPLGSFGLSCVLWDPVIAAWVPSLKPGAEASSLVETDPPKKDLRLHQRVLMRPQSAIENRVPSSELTKSKLAHLASLSRAALISSAVRLFMSIPDQRGRVMH